MRVHIKATDLSIAQWSWLNLSLPDTQEFQPDDVRACLELELNPEVPPVHTEMPVREFVKLMTRLAQISRTAEAALTPDSLEGR